MRIGHQDVVFHIHKTRRGICAFHKLAKANERIPFVPQHAALFRGAYEGSGIEPPFIPTPRVQQKLFGVIKGLDELIAEPMAFAASPHIRFVHGNESGTQDYIHVRQKMVLPERI